FSAPSRAIECSTCTEPRSRTTSAAVYPRATPFQRGLSFQWLSICAADCGVMNSPGSVDVFVGVQRQERLEFGSGRQAVEVRGGTPVVTGFECFVTHFRANPF